MTRFFIIKDYNESVNIYLVFLTMVCSCKKTIYGGKGIQPIFALRLMFLVVIFRL